MKLGVLLSVLGFLAIAAACTGIPNSFGTPPTGETPGGLGTEAPSPDQSGGRTETHQAISTTVPPQAGQRCATYFRTSSSDQMIQGTWTDDPGATSSISSCLQYVDREILDQPGYAQPGDAVALTIVLIPESRHTYDLPRDIDMGKEFVASLFFPGATGTPITELVICASYYLTPGIDGYIQGSWTDGNDDPSAVTSKPGCFDYMRAKILDEPYCAQGLGTDHVLLALLTQERHTFYLPADVEPEAELVAVVACTNVPPTPTATAFYGWTLTPTGPPGTITPFYGWTPTPSGPTATATPYIGWSATPTAGALTLTAAALVSKTPTPPGDATATPTAYFPGTPAPPTGTTAPPAPTKTPKPPGPGGATVSATALHTKTPTPPGGATVSATGFHTKTPTPPGGATVSATVHFTSTPKVTANKTSSPPAGVSPTTFYSWTPTEPGGATVTATVHFTRTPRVTATAFWTRTPTPQATPSP